MSQRVPRAGPRTRHRRAPLDRVLITATDEFVVTRGVSPETWQMLAGHLTTSQFIEFCLLAAQYDGLAATIATLQVPLHFPD